MTDTTGWLIDTTGWLTTPGDWQQHGVTDTTGWLINTAGWLSATTRWLTDTSGWLQELSQERKFHWGGFTWLLMLSQHACSSGTAITSLNNGYYLSKEFFDPCVDLCGWLHIFFWMIVFVCVNNFPCMGGWLFFFIYDDAYFQKYVFDGTVLTVVDFLFFCLQFLVTQMLGKILCFCCVRLIALI